MLAALLVIAVIVPACNPTEAYGIKDCTRADLGGQSVARVWDEQLLSLIREVVPAPTVHARNLFHTSAAMWDAWAAYDPTADGYFVTEKQTADDKNAAREAAMSYAAYRILSWRYSTVSDLKTAQAELDATMASLCYKTDFVSTEGDSPAALGNRIGEAVVAYGKTDGAKEDERYKDASYKPVNPPLEVGKPGTVMEDPNRWQPLSLAQQLSQNGIPIPGNIQSIHRTLLGRTSPGFAVPASDTGTPYDPGPPPRLGDPATDAAFKQEAVEVLRYSSELDASQGVTLDIGPGASGDNTLGTNDGDGHDVNPATGEPYPPDIANRADFYRVLAEFWADGPKSETPPGHWNLVANTASDAMGSNLRIGGTGEPVDRLEWDTKMYLALNGAVHDAAIAAWGLKGYYDSARPISMIRYMGGKGQSSDPGAPVIRSRGPAADARPGRGHHRGLERTRPAPRRRSAITSARSPSRHGGLPEGPEDRDEWRRLDPRGGLGPLPARRPSSRPPSRATSAATARSAGPRRGHDGLHRDAVLPGRLLGMDDKAGDLKHEEGPTKDVDLQWGTYFDAADQAGLSRLILGIHIAPDDLEGRRSAPRSAPRRSPRP